MSKRSWRIGGCRRVREEALAGSARWDFCVAQIRLTLLRQPLLPARWWLCSQCLFLIKKKLGIILQQLAYRASCRELRGPRPVLHRLRPGSLPGRWRVTWLRRTNRVATSMFTWPSGCETTSKVIFGESGLGGAGLGEIVQCLRAVLECSGSCILANVQDLLYTRARTSRLRRRKQRRCYGFKIDRRACDRKTLQPLKLLKDPTSASQLVWILYALILISN